MLDNRLQGTVRFAGAYGQTLVLRGFLLRFRKLVPTSPLVLSTLIDMSVKSDSSFLLRDLIHCDSKCDQGRL